jgi:hypothetical protein
VPEIWFTDEYKTQIGGKINSSRKDMRCVYCEKRKTAFKQGHSCIECDFKECSTRFHVRCAIKNGLIYDEDKMDEEHGCGDD